MLKGAVLYAKEMERLIRFYVAIGGEQTDGSEGEFAVISKLHTELIILQAPKEIASRIAIDNPPLVRTSTPIKPILEVSSIDEALMILPDFGGQLVPGVERWKFRKYLVQDIVDPEGNVLQLWQMEDHQS